MRTTPPATRSQLKPLQAGSTASVTLVRHDPAQKLYGYVLFGQPGSGAATFASSAAAIDDSIPDTLVDEARRLFGYRVLPTP